MLAGQSAGQQFCHPFPATISGEPCVQVSMRPNLKRKGSNFQAVVRLHIMTCYMQNLDVSQSLIELEAFCCRAAAQTNKNATERPGQKLIDDDVFHN